MRGYARAAGALGAFFLGLLLWLSDLAPRAIDWIVLALFVGGLALGVHTYLKEPALRVRRMAVIAAGLNGAALVLHASALF